MSERKKRTVTFLGMLPGAPIDPASDVWGISYAYLHYAHVLNRLFVMHNPVEFEQMFVDHVRELTVPVFCTREWPQWPNSVAFPLSVATDRFRGAPWTWSGAYMFASALMEGYDRIELGGMAYEGHSLEYLGYLPCTYYWIGLARGLGVEVETIGDTCLLEPMRWEARYYGYQINTAGIVAQQFVHAGYAGAHQIPTQFVETEDLTERNRIHSPQRQAMIGDFEQRRQERQAEINERTGDVFIGRRAGEERE